MKANSVDQVHEPEAELANAGDALQDAARLRAVLHQRERSVQLRVPLSALLDALDALDPKELRQVAQHAQDRLTATGQR
ncbi:MAG TPA: hypothetical protein VII92_16870 [Anaerolineae bacterium]